MRGAHVRLYVAGGVIAALVLVALAAPWLAAYDPRAAVAEPLHAPSGAHWLGTDLLGRDVLSRTLYGGRRMLVIAALALLVTVPPGLAVGVLAGYAGRWVDAALMALVDAMLAFPSLLLALALVALVGRGTAQIAVAVGVAGVPTYARMTRAAVLEARSRPFVEAARALGTPPLRIMAWHIVPTVAPTLIAFAGVSLSWALLNSAALTFLGYSGDISAPDWGVMLAEGRAVFRTAPWVALAPGVALSALVLALNGLASGLALPPRR